MITPTASQAATIDTLMSGIVGFGSTTLLLDLQPAGDAPDDTSLRVACVHSETLELNVAVRVNADGSVVDPDNAPLTLTADEAIGILHDALDEE